MSILPWRCAAAIFRCNRSPRLSLPRVNCAPSQSRLANVVCFATLTSQQISVEQSIFSTARDAILRVLRLFPHRFEQPADADVAHLVGEESRDQSATVGINRVGGAGFVPSLGFEGPRAVAYFYSNNTGLLRRTELVCRAPPVEKNNPIRFRPLFVPNPQGVIAPGPVRRSKNSRRSARLMRRHRLSTPSLTTSKTIRISCRSPRNAG